MVYLIQRLSTQPSSFLPYMIKVIQLLVMHHLHSEIVPFSTYNLLVKERRLLALYHAFIYLFGI